MKSTKSRKTLLSLYKKMVLIRQTEESFVNPILNGTIKCPVHLYTGQEAVVVGLSAHLKNGDVFFGNHRSHGHYLTKGGNLYRMIAEIYCKEDGCARGRGGSMHLIDKQVGMLGAAPIVGGTISLTLGTSLVLKNKKKKNIAIAFFGDGATGEGVLFESINFAALRKLPIIFACENNFYSTHLPIRETRPNYPIYKIGIAFGIKSFQVDGNDILKTLELGRQAVSLCREGEGPVFIEFKTYRMRGHVGPDDNIQGSHSDIRPKKEIDHWKKRDPITKFEKYLLENKVCYKEELFKIKNKIDTDILNFHNKAAIADWPKPEELNKYVFKQ